MGVGVGVGVGTGVGVGAGVGVGEPEAVGVGEGDGLGSTPELPPGPLQLAVKKASAAMAKNAIILGLERTVTRFLSRKGKSRGTEYNLYATRRAAPFVWGEHALAEAS